MKKKRTCPVSLVAYMQRRVQQKRQLNKISTSDLYQVAVNHFIRFTGNPDIRLDKLTSGLITDFRVYLQCLRLRPNTVNSYLSSLRALYHAACREGLLDETVPSPFRFLKLRREQTAKRAIPVSLIQQVAQLETTTTEKSEQKLAADLFLFSFMACGMPFVDLIHLTRANLHGNELVYRRRKTGTLIRLELTAGMKQIIRRYDSGDTNQSFLFPLLAYDGLSYARYKYCLFQYNKTLKDIGRQLAFPDKLTSYVARHSWASAALRCNVPVAIISQALGHTSEMTTRCYLSELDVSELARANQKVSGSIDRLLSRTSPKQREKSYL